VCRIFYLGSGGSSRLFLVGLALLVLAGCSSDKKAEKSGVAELVVPGSGSCEIILKELASSYQDLNPGSSVSIPPSIGSTGGVKAVGEGQASIARVGRRPKQSESQYELEYRGFARDALVFAVGKGVTGVENLTAQEILAIYDGTITSWDEVGGPDREINLIVREKNETTRKLVGKVLPGFSENPEPVQAKVVFRDFEVLELLKKFPNSIGYTTMSNLLGSEEMVTVLKYNGVQADAASLVSGAYPFSLEMGFVFKSERMTTAARDFLDFATGPEAAAVITKQGMVPLGVEGK
jgi:phosphate transport system substrate-binding protein